MSAPVSDEQMFKPFELINEIFEAKSNEASTVAPHDEWKIPELYHAWLQGKDNFDDIPLITEASMLRGTTPANSLVRYRGMIRDMYAQEFVPAVIQEQNDGNGEKRWVAHKYIEEHQPSPGHSLAEFGFESVAQRISFLCTPMPGLTAWASERRAQPPVSTFSSTAPSFVSSSRTSKRRMREDEMDEDTPDEPVVEQAVASSASPSKAVRQRVAEPGPGLVRPAHTSGVSLDHEAANADRGVDCLVRMYDGSEQSLQIAEMVEFIGVYGGHEEGSGPFGGTQTVEQTGDYLADLLAEERAAHNPPRNSVPRLHCLAFRRLPSTFPALPSPKVDGGKYALQPASAAAVPKPTESSTAAEAPMTKSAVAALQSLAQEGEASGSGTLSDLRQQICDYFAALLGGDILAAEYLLLQLLSVVESREGDAPLGSVSLNLTGFPEAEGSASPADLGPAGQRLKSGLSVLMPKVTGVAVNVAALESDTYFPVKNHETNTLKPGVLQLSQGTSLIVDETVIGEGQLRDQGLKNLNALQRVTKQQILPYDFQFHAADFECDVRVLLLSCKRALLKADIVLPLQPESVEAMLTGEMPLPEPVFLRRARTYLAACRYLPFGMDDSVRERISSDFVAERARSAAAAEPTTDQSATATPSAASGLATAEDLHRHLTLSRLLSRSFGAETLTAEAWAQVQAMEAERVQRVGTMLPAPPAAGGGGTIAEASPARVSDVPRSS